MSDQVNTVYVGRADVIPGYILSKPGIKEIGEAEQEFARRYLAMIGAGMAGLSDKLQRDVALDAKNDILYAQFASGGSVYRVWSLARSSLPLLTWLSLRVKHADMSLEKVAKMYVDGDADKMAAATWEVWGILPPAPPNGAAPAIVENAPNNPPATDEKPANLPA